MSIFSWCTRRAGGLSLVVVIGLITWVVVQRARYEPPEPPVRLPPLLSHLFEIVPDATGADLSAIVFAYYTLFLHVLVSLFPLRACWAIWGITSTVKRSVTARANSEIHEKGGFPRDGRRGSQSSLSSSTTLTSDLEVLDTHDHGVYTESQLSAFDTVVHAIVIPNYKEETDTLRETLQVLASHSRAQNCYDVRS